WERRPVILRDPTIRGPSWRDGTKKSSKTRSRVSEAEGSRMKLIVTGGTGFLGSRLLPLLVAAGFQIRCLVRRPEARGWLEGQGCEVAMGDLANPQSLVDAFQGCAGLVNVASLGFGHAPA